MPSMGYDDPHERPTTPRDVESASEIGLLMGGLVAKLEDQSLDSQRMLLGQFAKLLTTDQRQILRGYLGGDSMEHRHGRDSAYKSPGSDSPPRIATPPRARGS